MSRLVQKYKSLSPLLRASFWFIICGFLQRGISVITTPIFTRLLSTAEYGQYNVFNSWLSIAQVVVSLNIFHGVYTQGLVKFSDERDVYSSSLQGLALTLVSVWTVIYFIFQEWFNARLGLSTVQVLAMLVMVWSTGAFYFWSSNQRVDYKYRALVIVTLIMSVAKPVLGIILVMNAEDKVTARILGLAIVELAGYSWMFIYHMKRGKRFFSARYWKYALLFNIPLLPHYLSQVFLSSVDRIMISSMVGDSEAGIYSLAYQISQIMTIFNLALNRTIEPWIYRQLKDRRIDSIKKAAYPAFTLIALVNLAVIALAPEVVTVFAPSQYHEAIWVVPPVTMSVYFMFSYTFFSAFEFYYEKNKLISVATVTGAALNIVLNWLLIPRFGYLVAGYTTLTCYVLYAVMHYLFMRWLSRINFEGREPFDLRVLLAITAAFLVGGFILMATYEHPLLRAVLVCTFLFAAFLNRKVIIASIREITDLNKTKAAS